MKTVVINQQAWRIKKAMGKPGTPMHVLILTPVPMPMPWPERDHLQIPFVTLRWIADGDGRKFEEDP